MKVTKISFPTYLEECIGIENENIDVFVEEEDGYTYTFVVATAKNIEYLMDKWKMKYFSPGHPFIIVKKLTQEIIEETIKDLSQKDNGYWLKLYQFADQIDETVFNQLEAEDREEQKESDNS
jgi:hypothetical protein